MEKQLGIALDVKGLLDGSAHRMSHVFRYSSVPVCRQENVAEHSWYVAFYAFLVGHDLIRQDINVDMGVLLSRALVHDIDESLTGDFLRHVKYGHPDLKRVLDEVSVQMIEKMGFELGAGGENIKEAWSTAKADDVEGQIIAVVDLARVLSYVWEEIQYGNEHVRHILGECITYIQEFIQNHMVGSHVRPYAVQIIDWAQNKLR